MDIKEILVKAVSMEAFDIFIVAGLPVSIRDSGRIMNEAEEMLKPADTESLVRQVYEQAGNRDISRCIALSCKCVQAERVAFRGHPRDSLPAAGSEGAGHSGQHYSAG